MNIQRIRTSLFLCALNSMKYRSRFHYGTCTSVRKITYFTIFKQPPTYCDLLKFRNYSTSSENSDETGLSDEESPKITKSNAGKWKLFEDFDAPVILDVDEERKLRLEHPEMFEGEEEEPEDEFAGISLERGVTGVFDVEELVSVLRREYASKICVVAIPPEFRYVDYMVIVTGRSTKHLVALAEFIKKLYKRKKHESDLFLKMEGKESPDWMALDLGNIAIHFQSDENRKKYDLEMLWAVGSEHDDKFNAKEDDYVTLLQQHSELADIEPAERIVPMPDEVRKKLG